jgi:beta-galactosidase
MNCLNTVADIHPGPKPPEGVYARVVDGRTLLVNTTGEEKRIPVNGARKEIIGNRTYKGTVILGTQGAYLIP